MPIILTEEGVFPLGHIIFGIEALAFNSRHKDMDCTIVPKAAGASAKLKGFPESSEPSAPFIISYAVLGAVGIYQAVLAVKHNLESLTVRKAW
ncbi:hypothetical protein ES708_25703 [subsurface metagenome]